MEKWISSLMLEKAWVKMAAVHQWKRKAGQQGSSVQQQQQSYINIDSFTNGIRAGREEKTPKKLLTHTSDFKRAQKDSRSSYRATIQALCQLTAGLFSLTKSLLSSGFFPAFSGRWRGEPSDLDEAEEGGGGVKLRGEKNKMSAYFQCAQAVFQCNSLELQLCLRLAVYFVLGVRVNSQRALNLSPEPHWELELLEPLEELELPLPPLVLGTSFSTRSHRSRGSAELLRQERQREAIVQRGSPSAVYKL